jgi:hypothetical protein
VLPSVKLAGAGLCSSVKIVFGEDETKRVIAADTISNTGEGVSIVNTIKITSSIGKKG